MVNDFVYSLRRNKLLKEYVFFKKKYIREPISSRNTAAEEYHPELNALNVFRLLLITTYFTKLSELNDKNYYY